MAAAKTKKEPSAIRRVRTKQMPVAEAVDIALVNVPTLANAVKSVYDDYRAETQGYKERMGQKICYFLKDDSLVKELVAVATAKK